jgi:hypothetical protein
MDTKNLQSNSEINIYDFFLYFGGFTLFLGFYYFIILNWETTNPILQVIFTLVISLLLVYLGYSLIKKQNAWKLGFPLIFISLFLMPVGFYVLFYNLDKYLVDFYNDTYIYILAFLTSGIFFSIVNKMLKSTLILLFTFIYFCLFYGIFTVNYTILFAQFPFITTGIFSLSAMVLGFSGLYLSQYYKESNKFIYYFLSLFSINFLLGGAWFFNFFYSEDWILDINVIWMIFFPIFNFIILNIAIKNKEIFPKIFSVMYFVVFVIWVLFKYLDSRYYVATLLLVLGSGLLGTGYYLYLKKSKSIEDSNIEK